MGLDLIIHTICLIYSETKLRALHPMLLNRRTGRYPPSTTHHTHPYPPTPPSLLASMPSLTVTWIRAGAMNWGMPPAGVW